MLTFKQKCKAKGDLRLSWPPCKCAAGYCDFVRVLLGSALLQTDFAHSRCAKRAMGDLFRTIFLLCFCCPNTTRDLDVSTHFPIGPELIHLLALPARPLINLSFPQSEPEGGF